MKRVLLGMSGGVDSSVAAILLKEAGYEVIGATMTLWESNAIQSGCLNTKAINEAKKVCDQLGIEHYTFDFKDKFNECVIKEFIEEYKKCRTPNPCIECNRYLKFGEMYKAAKDLKCDFIATGHYAKTEYSDEYKQYVLKKSNAGYKDQSYVLYNLPRNMVKQVLFPLGEFENKQQIRKIAMDNGLLVANKPDSEDICFIPDGDYKKFLEENSNIKEKNGNIVNKEGKILGTHTGLYKYTIGQRKGLGISNNVPLFVKDFNIEKNELIVGEEAEIFSNEAIVDEVNFILMDKIKEPIEVMAKVRYAAKEAKAMIYEIEDEKIKVEFNEQQRAITPGQSIVFYINDLVLGGGKII